MHLDDLTFILFSLIKTKKNIYLMSILILCLVLHISDE